jgi:hypothetical protein
MAQLMSNSTKENKMSKWLIRIAAAYFMVGVSMGVYMGTTHHFEQMPVHAHINLLGWVSLGLIGALYHLKPRAAQNRLAKAHFVLHNAGLPVMAGGLSMLLGGDHSAEPIVGIGSILVALGVLCVSINLIRHADA